MGDSHCIHCGAYVPTVPEALEKWEKRHGPGRCVPACTHCRQNIPHAEGTCGWDENIWGPSPRIGVHEG